MYPNVRSAINNTQPGPRNAFDIDKLGENACYYNEDIAWSLLQQLSIHPSWSRCFAFFVAFTKTVPSVVPLILYYSFPCWSSLLPMVRRRLRWQEMILRAILNLFDWNGKRLAHTSIVSSHWLYSDDNLNLAATQTSLQFSRSCSNRQTTPFHASVCHVWMHEVHRWNGFVGQAPPKQPYTEIYGSQ